MKGRKIIVSCIAFYLVFNTNFLMGYLNYCFGLGLALLVITFFARRDLKVSPVATATLFLSLYLAHFVSLALVLIFLVIYAYHNKQMKTLCPFVIAAIPVILLFLQYFFSRSAEDLNYIPYREDLHYRIHIMIHWLLSVTIPFHHYKWILPQPIVFEGINYLFSSLTAVLIIYIFYKAWKKRIWSLELRLAVTLFIPIVILPEYFGGLLNPASRLVILFILNIIILFFSKRRSIFKERLCVALLILLVGTSYLYNMVYTYTFDKQVSTGVVTLNSIIQDSFAWEGTNGFEHFIFYHGVTHNEILSPFRSGLFAYPVNSGGVSFENR
jgi:hypothetical protein